MNYEYIKQQLFDSSRILADLTADMVYDNPDLLKLLLEVSWMDEVPWCQRASRVFAICCCRFPELVKPYASSIISKLGNQKSESVRRNLLKIFTEINIKLSQRDKSKLLNLCFDYLTGPYSIGVQVYSMDILYKLSLDYPEIQRELFEIIENMLPGASVGFKSRGKKILDKMTQAARSIKLR